MKQNPFSAGTKKVGKIKQATGNQTESLGKTTNQRMEKSERTKNKKRRIERGKEAD